MNFEIDVTKLWLVDTEPTKPKYIKINLKIKFTMLKMAKWDYIHFVEGHPKKNVAKYHVRDDRFLLSVFHDHKN